MVGHFRFRRTDSRLLGRFRIDGRIVPSINASFHLRSPHSFPIEKTILDGGCLGMGCVLYVSGGIFNFNEVSRNSPNGIPR